MSYITKKFLTVLFLLILTLINYSSCAYSTELYRVKPVCFDISNLVVFIPIKTSQQNIVTNNLSYTKLDNENGIELTLSSAALDKQFEDIRFSEGSIKNFQIVQSENFVKIKIIFEPKYNLDKLKIGNINNNIIITTSSLRPFDMNYYINTYRDNDSLTKDYKESLILTTRTIEKKDEIEIKDKNNSNKSSMKEINQAFANSNITDNIVYTDFSIEDLTKNHRLRSKYYLFSANIIDNIFKLSGVGTVNIQKPFLLENPLRMVFDLPNTIINPDLHGKELNLPNSDILKLAQFNPTTTRLVVTSENAKQYIPVYSSDSQQLIIANPMNILTTHLPETKTNIIKFNYQKTNNTDNFLFEFDKPLCYALKRTNDYLFIYFLNAEKYNDTSFHNAIKNTPYSNLAIHLLSTGMRIRFPLKNKENINTYVSPDGKLFKLSSQIHQIIDEIKTPEKIKAMTKKEGSITSSPKITSKNNHKVVVIDAGHGGKDCGAMRENIMEKQINLDVCMLIQSILQRKGYKVYMTRTDDTYVSLEDRTIFTEGINPGAFVSVHVNSCNSDTPIGIETHYYHEESIELADAVHKNLIKRINTTNRGLLKSRFYVINHITVPAILVEIGFISNPTERQELTTKQRQQNTAEGIAEGIIEFLKSLDK